MKRLLLCLLVVGCKSEISTPEISTQLVLQSAPSGQIELAIKNAPDDMRAVQVELVIDSSAAWTLGNTVAGDGLPIDTVRLKMRGANRAIVFAGDKRGVRIGANAVIATFDARPTGTPTNATLKIGVFTLVNNAGGDVPASAGPAISLR